MRTYTGNLSRTGKTITTSRYYMVYDYRRDNVYLTSDDRQLVIDVVQAQSARDPDGDYAACELIGFDWCEMPVPRLRKAPAAHPPLFR
jgi:hypothetical protein